MATGGNCPINMASRRLTHLLSHPIFFLDVRRDTISACWNSTSSSMVSYTCPSLLLRRLRRRLPRRYRLLSPRLLAFQSTFIMWHAMSRLEHFQNTHSPGKATWSVSTRFLQRTATFSSIGRYDVSTGYKSTTCRCDILSNYFFDIENALRVDESNTFNIYFGVIMLPGNYFVNGTSTPPLAKIPGWPAIDGACMYQTAKELPP